MAFLDMGFIERAGARLHYRAAGDGPLVLLHHPLTADLTAYHRIGLWDRLLDAGLSVAAHDAAGHGRSGDPADPARFASDELARDALAVVDALGVERFAFIGYSLGACIGAHLAALAPHRLRALYIAGWDPIEGAKSFTTSREPAKRRAEFAALARALSPAALSEPRLAAWTAIYETLFAGQPPLKATRLRVACGAGDPYCANARAAAEAAGAPFDLLSGDHIGAFADPAFVEHAAAHAAEAFTRECT